MQTETIEKIKVAAEEVNVSLKSFLPKGREEERYGNEKEYTPKTLKVSVSGLLNDIRALVKAHNKFLLVSTHQERSEILSLLTTIRNALDQEDYMQVAQQYDQLKVIVRPYNVRGSTESQESLEERVNRLNGMCSEIEEELENLKNQSQQSSDHLQKILTSAESGEGVIKNFAQQIESRQQQLDQQQSRTDKYEEKLKSYEDGYNENINNAEKLIEGARTALGYTTAQGISAAFTERYNEDRSKKPWWWLVGALCFSLGSVGIGVWWLSSGGGVEFASVISRIAVMSAAFSGAWFCAAQYVQYKNTMEDYGYKAVLAKSMVAFLDKLTGEGKERYLEMVLVEIHKDPLRKRHDVDDGTLQRAINLLKKYIKANGEKGD